MSMEERRLHDYIWWVNGANSRRLEIVADEVSIIDATAAAHLRAIGVAIRACHEYFKSREEK